MISEFLTQIFGEQEGNVVVGLRDKPGADGKVNRYHWFAYPAEFDKMVSFAESHDQEDLYYSPILYGDMRNANDKISRTPENALTTQVIYADSDTAKPEDFRLSPSIVVETSTGRFHTYWYLTEPISAQAASEICHRVTTAHEEQGSDSNGWSANKVLRIPGSLNTSHGFDEDVTVHYTGEIYEASDISDTYSDIVTTLRAPMRPNAPARHVDVLEPEDLPDYGDSLDKVSTRTLELATSEPQATQDRSRLRYKLLLELMREPITFDEALSIAWHAPAARKWSQEDERGIEGLRAEAYKAEAEVEAEQAITGPEEDEDFNSEPVERVEMLTPQERASIKNERTFITDYCQHAEERVSKFNGPYHRINAWTILSLVYSPIGFIPRPRGKECLNMYSMVIGDTTTGKSEARGLKFQILMEVFAGDKGFDLGGNASPSALGKKLLERDQLPSYFNKDEAHGTLKTWMTQDWTTGIMEDLAELYDGKVPPQLRTGNWDESGKAATTFFSLQLMGTPKAMLATLSRDLFHTGFLARMQWVIGEPRTVTYDSMAEVDSDGEDIRLGYNLEAQNIAEAFRFKKEELEAAYGPRIPVRIERDAAKRLQQIKWELLQKFQTHKDWEILEPSIVRLGVTMRKAASLLALDAGRDVITMRDLLLAVEAAEEWATNLLTVVGQISTSDFARACDEVVEYIEEKGGSVKREMVMRKFRGIETRFLEGYVSTLVGQGRVKETTGKDRGKYLETVGAMVLQDA